MRIATSLRLELLDGTLMSYFHFHSTNWNISTLETAIHSPRYREKLSELFGSALKAPLYIGGVPATLTLNCSLFALFTFFTYSIQNGVLTQQGNSMVFQYMFLDAVHKTTFQVNNFSAFYALDMKMFMTVMFRFHIAICGFIAFF